MDIIRLLLLLIMLVFGGGQHTAQPVPPIAEPTFHDQVLVDEVDVLVMESYPAQISLHVKGSHGGCEYPVQVEQTRVGNTITVEIFREMPLAVACPMILLSYEDNIRLDGSFESGDYTIIVNGFVVDVTI